MANEVPSFFYSPTDFKSFFNAIYQSRSIFFYWFSNFTGIVCPMQNRLALFAPAVQIARRAVFFDLRDMAADRFPSFYLPLIIFGHSSAHMIAAIPLKPSARIRRVYPSLFAPHAQRLGGINPEIIQFWIMEFRIESGAGKPVFWKLFSAIGHIFAAENSHRQHLFGR